MPDLKNGTFVMLPVDDLIPYMRNSRTHTEEQVLQVASSIREFGFTSPVLIQPDLTIVAGHARVQAARKLEMSEVPCLVIGENWTIPQLKAYVIADNKLALNAGWDVQMLELELADLEEAGYDAKITGFNTTEIEAILNGWNPDLDPINKKLDGEDGFALLRLRCQDKDEEALREWLEGMLDSSGFENVELT